MRNIDQILKEIAAKQAEAEAIMAMVRQEEREPTTEENSRIDAIVGTADKPGEIQALKAEKDRTERFQSAVAKIIVEKEAEASKPVKVPARARSTSTLKAFKNEEDAYASGQFIMANLFGNKKAKSWCRDHGVRATMVSYDNTSGGFLVPDVMESSIIELREMYGVFRQNSNSITMSDSKMIMPRLNSEVTSYYVGEGATITASDLAINQVQLDAKKLAALTAVSSELNEDSVVSVAEMIARSVAQSFAVAEDQAGFLGDGTSTYGGIVGIAGALGAGSKVTATSRQTFSALTFADFESVVGACKMWPGAMPKWFISQAGWAASMQRLANGVGGATMAEIAGGMQKMFLGYPVVITQAQPSALTGTTGLRACSFGDLSMGSYIGTRRGISLAVDNSLGFLTDTINIRATQRYDIVVHDRGTASASGGIVDLIFG